MDLWGLGGGEGGRGGRGGVGGCRRFGGEEGLRLKLIA